MPLFYFSILFSSQLLPLSLVLFFLTIFNLLLSLLPFPSQITKAAITFLAHPFHISSLFSALLFVVVFLTNYFTPFISSQFDQLFLFLLCNIYTCIIYTHYITILYHITDIIPFAHFLYAHSIVISPFFLFSPFLLQLQ